MTTLRNRKRSEDGCLRFLDKNELLVTGIGLGSGFRCDTDENTIYVDFVYPTSGLAAALVEEWWSCQQQRGLIQERQSAISKMISSFLETHSTYHKVVLSDAIRSCMKAEAFPQGYRYLAWNPCSNSTSLSLQGTEQSSSWDSERKYMVRSMSKGFSSALILALQDRNILNIDHRIGLYLDEYASGERKEMTIRMLLCHTSGLPHFMAQVGDNSPRALTDHTMTLRESAAEIAKLPLSSPPGTEFHYTELGYQVAGAVAEVVCKKSWHQLFEEVLGLPLGLTNTCWYNTYVSVPRPRNPLIAIGAVTDSRDLQVLVQMLLNKGKHVNPVTGQVVQVLSKDSAEQFFKRQDLGDTTKDAIFAQNGNLMSAAISLEEAHVLSPYEAECVKYSWNNVGYGLGAWLAETEDETSHAFFLGAYNGVVSVLGLDTPNPLCTMLMTYAKSNVSHAVLSGLAWRQWMEESSI